MEVVSTDKESSSVVLTHREAILLNNALNEVCNALGIQDFQTRLGITKDEARVVLKQFSVLLTNMSAAP
jgi:hypothetical protein